MKIVIAGAGEVGSHLAKMLNNETNEVTVIDERQDRLDALAAITDVITVEGNPSTIGVLVQAGVQYADLFIAVNPSDSQDVNIVSAMLAKKLGSKKVTARINNEEYLSYENKHLFTEMGIDLLFYPEKIAAGEIADLLKRTATTDSLEFARGKLQVVVFKLEEESELIGMNMAEFSAVAAAEGLKFRVVAISRNDETIIPKFDTKFKYHDLVFIISTREGMDMLMRYVGKENIEVKNIMILGGSPIGEMVAKQMSKQLDSSRSMSEFLPSPFTTITFDGSFSDRSRHFSLFISMSLMLSICLLICFATISPIGLPPRIMMFFTSMFSLPTYLMSMSIPSLVEMMKTRS